MRGQRVRLLAGDRLLLRAGDFGAGLFPRADEAARARRLALGGAGGGARGGVVIGFLRFAPAGEPALARAARPARRGRRDPAPHRGARSRPNRAGPLPPPGPPEPVSPAGRFADLWRAADARARDPDERVQRVPDRRLLRLPELGADAAGQPGHRDHQEPRLHHRHRARRAGGAADRVFPRRTDRAQMGDRRPAPASSSSAASCSARRARRS